MFKKINLIKFLDRTFGRLLVNVLPVPKPKRAVVEKLLVIRPGGIGDAVLLVPALNAIKACRPCLTIDVLAERRNAGVFTMAACVDRVFLYDSLPQLSQALRRKYDVVVDSEQWYRLSAIIARLIRSSTKVGYQTNRRSRMFTHPVAYSLDNNEVESFHELLQAVQSPLPRVQLPWLAVNAEQRARALCLLGNYAGKQFVTVFAGASVPEKQWPLNSFRELVAQCIASGYRVVLVGGRGDVARSIEIASEVKVLNLTGQTGLAETAAILAQTDAFISGDSGLLHLAAAFKCPTLALFGPSNTEKWAPAGSKHIVINKDFDCSPCSMYGTIPDCKNNIKCLSDIHVAEVFSALQELLPKGKESTCNAC